MVNEVIQIVSDKVNELFGRSFVSKTNIKNEFSSMLERHLAPDWADDGISDEEVIDTDSEIDIGNIDDIDDTNEIEIKTENITSNISVETSDDSIDSEIDDITQQCIAEREQNRTIIDLQSDNED